MLLTLVHIGVFGLFHPSKITVRPGSAAAIICGSRVLEGTQTATLGLSNLETRISSPSGGAADIVLAVPGRIERLYRGTALIKTVGEELIAVIEMDREVAVASIVAAELPPGAPLEALKAQAVLARSFLAASPPRHRDFDFCDTTHCQFLRAWPNPGQDAYRAASETRGILLTYRGTAIAPRYSAACGGHTISSEADEPGSHGYRYQSVPCNYCLRHSAEPARGHRLGLCQQGASAMALSGATYREILNHYYPGTKVTDFHPR